MVDKSDVLNVSPFSVVVVLNMELVSNVSVVIAPTVDLSTFTPKSITFRNTNAKYSILCLSKSKEQ